MAAAGVAPRSAGGAAAVFASFRLGDGEFAVDVQHVQEVVRRPEDLRVLPLLPDYALGVFNLRGMIIPLLCTHRLLGREGTPLSAEAKVAIVYHRGVRLGLACDDTSRVLRPRADEYAPVRYTDGSVKTIASGVLRMPDGLLPVLDLDLLLGLQEIPFGDTELTDAAKRRALRSRKRCITFRVGATWMALPISEFHEIVRVDGLEPPPLADPSVHGVLRQRGRVVPVVALGDILNAAPSGAEVDAAAADLRRVIVLTIDTQQVGFLVDAVEAIESYYEDDMMAVPVLTARHARVYAGSLELGSHGLVFLLSRVGLGADVEVQRVAEQYRSLFAAAEASAEAAASSVRGAMKAAYLWFRAATDFALPMREIKEIVEVRDPLIPLPGTPPFVRGMLNLRGKIVTVVDARAFFELPDDGGDRSSDHTILVLEQDDTLVGFSVDRVESILHVSAQQRFGIPAMLRSQLPAALRDDIREVVRITGASDSQTDLLVLNAARLLAVMRDTPPAAVSAAA